MSSGPEIARTMKLRRKAIAIMLLTVTLLIAENLDTAAQDAPPDLHMLMNLDLFASHPSDDKGPPAPAHPADDSMLEQIRALNAMGYLGGNSDSAERESAGPRNAAGASATPASRPTYSIEDQQR
jgi:hypothetical protein